MERHTLQSNYLNCQKMDLFPKCNSFSENSLFVNTHIAIKLSTIFQSMDLFEQIGQMNTKYNIITNVREYRRGNQKWTIQRNWQHRVDNTRKSSIYQSKDQYQLGYAKTGITAYTRDQNTKKRLGYILYMYGMMQLDIKIGLIVNKNQKR